MRMLIQTQLSNYDASGKFILECDSGWQMVMGRVRIMLELDPDLHVDVIGPWRDEDDADGVGQLITHPFDINPDLWGKHGPEGSKRLGYVPLWIEPNALATRFNFDMDNYDWQLGLKEHRTHPSMRYDIVFINDPMHLRNFRALFHLRGGYTPKFVVHSHFIDNPSCPKFPTEASLWLGQCEAAIRADWNFWQCESSMQIFMGELGNTFARPDLVWNTRAKSSPWDDGYSSQEINVPFETSRVRFDPYELARLGQEKVIIFVPNRIGGLGRSSDYTNCGKFMFEHLPELARLRASKTGDRDYVVICGNPSQKILNSELTELCGATGYHSLVPDVLRRDEFKAVASAAHVVVGLYTNDSYGGTVARECVDMGCLPFWADNYEYTSLAAEADWRHLTHPSLCRVPIDLSNLIDDVRDPSSALDYFQGAKERLQRVVRSRCSYEETTGAAMRQMKGLLA